MVCVPRALQSLHRLIEQEGMAEKIQVREFMWQLIPLDADLLSLELPHLIPSLIENGDYTFLSTVAKALFSLESLYGAIPNKLAVGKKSSGILAQLELLESR